MEDVDWSFYLLKSCYLIHKNGRTIAEEPCIVAELLVFLSLCLLECVQCSLRAARTPWYYKVSLYIRLGH